jgi:hypothetical protein
VYVPSAIFSVSREELLGPREVALRAVVPVGHLDGVEACALRDDSLLDHQVERAVRVVGGGQRLVVRALVDVDQVADSHVFSLRSDLSRASLTAAG